jgi:Fe-S cluster assembly iron-binding protein IscA
VNFGMALDNNFRDVDTTFDSNGVRVVVDDVSIDYLREATIDFINDPQRGAGFSVNSPNAQKKSHEHASQECGYGSREAAAVAVTMAAVPVLVITNSDKK